MRRSPVVLSAAVSRLARHGAVSVWGRGYRSGSDTVSLSRGGSPVTPSLQEKSGVHARSSHHLDLDLAQKISIGENISRKDRFNFLVNTLLDLRDSKESVYGALDAWVAWERDFPIASLRKALIMLEKEHQWHRIIQVIKWMLSKGQGNTMGVYRMLIQALDMDHRAEEAHRFWEKKIGNDFHSVPWKLCTCMIGIYYRNNMLEHLVTLFKGLEAFDRKPPEKSVVQRVSDAYEALGLPDEKTRVLEKYKHLFVDKTLDRAAQRVRSSSREGKKEEVNTHQDSVD
ncbi:hypothetical protein MLD38_039632 [Melastoma candidum]|uniref:Uncharacterized protein n=1 Tax=Melastoma candidum TaxID=119954 RepID=A0ACB9L3K7_9MYRT|nr:hypothetical protein MLD38_039632 [Melastoma candidum]